MASPANTTRRSLFAIATAATLLPAAAMAAPLVQPEPWDQLIAALAVLHPDLPGLALQARQQGYAPSELRIIMIPQNGERPFLEFYKDFLGSHLRAAGNH